MSKVKLTIDGREVEVDSGTTVFQAAVQLGIKVPHYCYHPGLSLAGNCRMCMVEVDKAPKPVASCVAPVAEGMVVKTQTENVEKMRKSVMEFLLINHPLDCPTCDQAGECRLQDYYMSYDRVPSRFHEEKVQKDKMVDLGANVMLDQERCVACTRCIRFCQEVAGEDELVLANRGDHTTITTFPGKDLSNPYAGNVVDVCPVGALTSKDFRYKKRVWFLKSTPSICPGCSRGCNINIQQEESKVYRLLPRYNPDVNRYWMCDEGRYGYKNINEGRILRAVINGKNGGQVSFETALEQMAQILSTAPFQDIGVVAHAAETNESLESLKQFAQNTLKTKHLFYSRYEPVNPSSDSILVTADKNPNQASVTRLGFAPLSSIADSVKALIVQRELTEAELKMLDEKKVPIVALMVVNESETCRKAKILLPIPSYAEQEGHFVNVDGRQQKLTAAFEPRGESRFVWEWLNDLSSLLSNSRNVA